MTKPNTGLPWGTPEQIAEICRRYKEGESAFNLAKSFGVSHAPITRALRLGGVLKRTHSQATTRHQCDHSFFNSIDSEAKAYWLGFLAADGGIMFGDTIRLALAPYDRDHLERWRAAIQATQPVYESKHQSGYVHYGVNVTSQEMTSALAEFGIVQGKTFSIQWPELPSEMLRHFARGYSDGDGGFVIAARGDVKFSVTSYKDLIEGFQSYLMRCCELRLTKLYARHKDSPHIVTMTYSGSNQVARIFHHLYDEATVFLPRKRDKIASRLSM
jgi:hypothetical protein